MKPAIKVEFFYHTPAPYGVYQHKLGTFYIRRDMLRMLVRNFPALDMCGVTVIRYCIESETAFQTAGYSERRGSFCDLMPWEEVAPYVREGYTATSTTTEEEAAQRVFSLLGVSDTRELCALRH